MRDAKGRFIKGHKKSNTGRTCFKKGIQIRLGSKHSIESRRKMSESKKGVMPKNLDWLVSYKRPRGSDHPLWRGATDESKLWRTRKEYSDWRKSVFCRDDWTCQRCLKRGGRIHPHHIESFAEVAEKRFKTENGITLCEPCHKLFHRIYGRTGINQTHIEEYVKEYQTT